MRAPGLDDLDPDAVRAPIDAVYVFHLAERTSDGVKVLVNGRCFILPPETRTYALARLGTKVELYEQERVTTLPP